MDERGPAKGCRLTKPLLTDFAFVQYNALDSTTTKNYKNTMTALNAVFAIDKKPLSFRRNYINRKQKYNESVRDFSAEIMQRFAECNPPLETQVDVYTNMLNPLIAAEIQDEEYTDMKTLVACAEKAEHRLRLRREASQSGNHISFDRRSRRDQSRGRSRDRRSHSRQGYKNRYNRSRSDGNEITAAVARSASRIDHKVEFTVRIAMTMDLDSDTIVIPVTHATLKIVAITPATIAITGATRATKAATRSTIYRI